MKQCQTQPTNIPRIMHSNSLTPGSRHRLCSLLIILFAAALLMTSCSPQSTPPTQSSSGPSVFQMRFVEDNPTPETEPLALLNSNTNTPQETLNVRKEVSLDHTALSSASVERLGPSNTPTISILLTDKGRKAFAELTRENLGKRLAIVVDGKLLTAPIIRGEIPGGSAMITGNFSEKEANDLANKINNAIKK